MPLHFLQESLVGRQERKSHHLRQGNVGGIIDCNSVGSGDGVDLSQEVPGSLVNLQVQIVKQVKC